ncbi:MAG: PEGA domain-containing protein [Candidatus Competibacter sp.]|nr:PEGA domain-containing protein [Candidatus Competibacter sp.]MDG4584627.1 PEGA domain-containing protein [Candidatus Competibacter sp.]
MARRYWIILSGMALAFGIQSAGAGGAWLVITSEPPGATIVVDSSYRGVTPQRPGDALRIQVAEGTRKINAHVQIDGKDYATEQTVKVRGTGETAIKLQLRAEPVPAPVVPVAPTSYTGKPWYEWSFPPGSVEVPGRNF